MNNFLSDRVASPEQWIAVHDKSETQSVESISPYVGVKILSVGA